MGKRSVELLIGIDRTPVVCEEIVVSEFPAKGSIVGDFMATDVRQISVGGADNYRYANPLESEEWQWHIFFECEWQPIDKSSICTCKKSYFCIKGEDGYDVVCVCPYDVPELIDVVFYIPTTSELKERYSKHLFTNEDRVQVLNEAGQTLIEYCPGENQ